MGTSYSVCHLMTERLNDIHLMDDRRLMDDRGLMNDSLDCGRKAVAEAEAMCFGTGVFGTSKLVPCYEAKL
jgi:hypothetical protein